ncbi:GntR family transcriptional regulator [Sedimentibacter hydroxybenzoicus DSM 7310]|uniref:GntR family transcriptional regulator n=1 Tax=Sedimentibacter hydroxybenzoicus DSM 7310 TaxID=1123245 RepID=A0A974GXW6_SEDHY|nr:GntR family transcriptional regulator [Sedimentibacter hydroxybenzoicus]NYB75983.1 GntR family transcriptional regulator [Sedimentibacter hydroxybenzoicus DSM 7310]
MEFNNNIPIYIQVIEKIKQEIVTGKLKPGEKMPSSRDYGNNLGINFNTVARVYKEMEMEELLFTRRGLGTFVTESEDRIGQLRYEMAKKQIENFIFNMKQIGYTKKDMIKFIETENYLEGDE